MKVTVNTFLNVRVGKPSVNAPCYQYLAPGSELEVDGQLYKGDMYEGSDQWYRDLAGNYYWAQGIELPGKPPPINSQNFPNLRQNYNQLVNLPDIVKASKGKGIVVAILDTGCFAHPMVKNGILKYMDIVEPGRSTPTDTSAEGHGTFVAGLIAANELMQTKTIGVAPEASLLIVRVAEDEDSFTLQNVIVALDKIRQQGLKPDIVNLSFDVSSEQHQDSFEKLLAQFPQTLFVAAGQDPLTQTAAPYLYYPAGAPGMVAVASLTRDDVADRRDKIHSRISYILLEQEYYSLKNSFMEPYGQGIGSSFATAIVSGALALVLAYLRQNNINIPPLHFLDTSCGLQKAGDEPLENLPKIYRL